jgi:CheY-like chemotaxis protein
MKMVSQNIPQQNLQSMHELTPRDDNKKIVSEVLKHVDQLIRKGELDCAQREIIKAKELDPRNAYAFALEERISALKTEFECTKIETECTEDIKRLDEFIQSSITSELPQPVAETLSMPPLSRPAPIVTSKTLVPLTATLPSLPFDGPTNRAIKNYEPQQERVVDRSIELESYRKTLAEMWYDGTLTPDEKHRLNELRTLLEITDAEHEGIEKNVKRECYKSVIIRQLSNNPISLSDAKSLSDLRSTFQISEEEHVQIQTQLMNVFQHKQRNKILVIDDDTRLLELLEASLEDNGFDVTALSTSDEAYALLRKFVPDLILCDINLETSTMGGFTFYEKVQELKNVQSIPFVFLSGLTDEVLVRTGKELGVDDYLMKPISEQTLVSTLRGKLKRFKQLKKAAENPMPAMVAA